MRRIIVFENVTADGFMADADGGIDWAKHDDEITQNAREGEDSADTFLYGRVTYDMMASFWPTPMAQQVNKYFADLLNKAPKIVISRTMDKAEWNNTTVMKGIDKEAILKLKNSPGKNIMIFGSGTIVRQLTDLSLIDEYQLMVNPVILGKGRPLFENLQQKVDLKLISTKTFRNGVVLLKYGLAE